MDKFLEKFIESYLTAERRRLEVARMGDRESAYYWLGRRSEAAHCVVILTGEPVDKALALYEQVHGVY